MLEDLASKFLNSQGLENVENVRVSGMEIDLLATDRQTGEKIFVECKAYRSNISADVITKLLGNVGLRDAASGWLITTHSFGKDAKGIQEEWSSKPPQKRRKLRFFHQTYS